MRIPTVEDFVCMPRPEDDLDGFCAWRNFGGLTVDEAYRKFCESPDCLQEDFMFMGDAAFVFYFPVLDRYVREEEPAYEMDGKAQPFDGQTHILGHCIGFHVSEDRPLIRPLHDSIIALCRFVLRGLENAPADSDRLHSPEEIKGVWAELLKKVTTGDSRD